MPARAPLEKRRKLQRRPLGPVAAETSILPLPSNLRTSVASAMRRHRFPHLQCGGLDERWCVAQHTAVVCPMDSRVVGGYGTPRCGIHFRSAATVLCGSRAPNKYINQHGKSPLTKANTIN